MTRDLNNISKLNCNITRFKYTLIGKNNLLYFMFSLDSTSMLWLTARGRPRCIGFPLQSFCNFHLLPSIAGGGGFVQVLTSDEVTKEVSFRKQPLDRGLLLVLSVSEVRREGLSKLLLLLLLLKVV